MASERNRDEAHREAFGEDIGISQSCKDKINEIKNNDPTATVFTLNPIDADIFSDLAWELLGRYIADNDHLDHVDLSGIHLTDEQMCLLFKHLTRTRSMTTLNLSDNILGLDGIQSMVSFFKNSRSLTTLNIGENGYLNNECFRLVVEALHGGSIEELNFDDCEIDDITALERYTLPRLQVLSLACNKIQNIPSFEQCTNLETLCLVWNNIGKEGCRSIANLLQKESSSLRELDLGSNDICDEAAEIIANSLKFNATLVDLRLGNNMFNEKGYGAFLKLLNDVSSIERTYNSNHTLTKLLLPHLTDSKSTEIENHIDSAIKTNEETQEDSDAGREKVIATHLNSNTRRELCHIQGIDYSYSSLFAEIDPVLLPDILALVGGKYGQNEIYRMLIATVPDLESVVNKKGLLKQKMAENVDQITALNADYIRKTAALTVEHLRKTADLEDKISMMKKELESIESGGVRQSMVDTSRSSTAKLCGQKRGRSTSS